MIGVSEMRAALARAAVQVDVVTRTVVSRGSALTVAEAKQNFHGSHKRGEPHEGDSFPNVVSGALRRSIVSSPVTRLGLADYAARSGPTMVYSRAVELKYTYPYFVPAVVSVRPKLAALNTSIWLAAFR